MITVALTIAPLSFALTSARLISPQALRSSKPENRATCKELETPVWNSARKHWAHYQRQPLASPACECAYLMLKNLAIQSCHQRHKVRPWLPLPSNFSGLYDLGNKGTALKCQYYNPETTNARTEVFTQLRFDLRFFGVFRFFMPSEQSNSHLVRFLFAHPNLIGWTSTQPGRISGHIRLPEPWVLSALCTCRDGKSKEISQDSSSELHRNRAIRSSPSLETARKALICWYDMCRTRTQRDDCVISL